MSILDFSTTADSNGTADANINAAEGQKPGTVNNGVRGLMTRLAWWANWIAGNLTQGGSLNAYTISSGESITSYSNRLRMTWKPNATSTGAVTLNVDAVGAKKVFRPDGVQAGSGDVLSGAVLDVIYVGTLDSGSGGFQIVGPAAITSAGRALLDDADAAAQRATLGLGAAALKDTGTSGNKVPLLDAANIFAAAQAFSDYAKVTNASGAQRLLLGNQDSGGANKPNIISAVNGQLDLGYGDSWSGSGGTLTSLLSLATGIVTSKVSHQFDAVTKHKLNADEQMMLSRNSGALIAFRNAAESTRFGFLRHDSSNITLINEVSGGELNINTTSGLTKISSITSDTTASAANGYFDAGSGRLQRSTSAARYKRDMEPITAERVKRFMEIAASPGVAIWYRSKCEGDPAGWGYYGFLADAFAEEFPQLVHWKTHETVTETEEVERRRPAMRQETHEEISIEDDRAVVTTRTREVPVMRTLPIYLEDGSPAMVEEVDEEGEPTGRNIQAVIQAPAMETYIEKVPRAVTRPLETPEVEGLAYERVTAFLALALAQVMAGRDAP